MELILPEMAVGDFTGLRSPDDTRVGRCGWQEMATVVKYYILVL